MIATAIETLEKRNFVLPDERRYFEEGQIELITMGDVTFGKVSLLPGWRWSKCVKPLVHEELCEQGHLSYHIAGHFHVKLADGSEMEFKPGDVSHIPAGHDAWVVGNEPVVMIDITGARDYARRV